MIGPCGSGVFVGYDQSKKLSHRYAVTSLHVIEDKACIIRINTCDEDGFYTTRFIELEQDDWKFIQSGPDIAAVDVTDLINFEKDVVHYISHDHFASQEFLQSVRFGIGEDGFMLGMFADLPGKKQNMIAARFGNVSLLADSNELIKQGHGFMHPSHIFDMRSRPGFSGSPVFVYRTPSLDIREIASGPSQPKTVQILSERHDPIRSPRGAESFHAFIDYEKDVENTFLKLFGIHSAQYRDAVTAKLKKHRSEGENDRSIKDGDELEIPNSMTIIVPAWEITKLLNEGVFVNLRQKRQDALASE